jgi:hypothetical protein
MAEVARQGAVIAELEAARDRQAAVNDGMAVRLVEQAEDVRELRALMRTKGKAPPQGMTALKEAAALTGANYETARRWCAKGVVHAQWTGLRWCVSLPSLAAELAKRRRSAA